MTTPPPSCCLEVRLPRLESIKYLAASAAAPRARYCILMLQQGPQDEGRQLDCCGTHDERAAIHQQESHENLKIHHLPPRAEPPQHERGELEVDGGVLVAAGHVAYT